jgi:hypothetical protein
MVDVFVDSVLYVERERDKVDFFFLILGCFLVSFGNAIGNQGRTLDERGWVDRKRIPDEELRRECPNGEIRLDSI